jgi:hypothetical protein
MAEANIGGGSVEYICLWLPVSVGEQIYHSLLRRARCRTYAPCESAEAQVEKLEHAQLPAGFLKPSPELAAVLARFDSAPQ